MNSEIRFWTVIAALLATVVLAVTLACFLTFWHMHRMAELGFEERVVPGSHSPLWQKIVRPAVAVCGCGCPKSALASPASTSGMSFGWTGSLAATNDLPVLKFVDGGAIWE